MSDESIIVGKDYFSAVKSIVKDFGEMVSSKSEELNTSLSEKIQSLNEQLKLWKQKESDIQTKIDLKKKELAQQGIPFDLGKINQISKDILDYEKKVRILSEDKNRLKELEKTRKNIIQQRQDNKKEINRLHLAFAQRINTGLKNSVDDFYINIKYNDNLFSPEFESTLKELMGWRTSQVPKATLISKSISVYDFVNAIKTKNTSTLSSITYNGSQLLSKDDISSIINRLNEDYQYEELECVAYDDLPQITVTKLIDEAGTKKPKIKRLSQLSLGQQQSVLLGILLLSDSNRPLLINVFPIS